MGKLLKIFFESMTETILSDRVCKNCKWINESGEYLDCLNKNNNDPLTGCYMGVPNENFGCNQFEKKE